MKSKRLLSKVLLVSACLVLISAVLMIGCAKPSPTPTPKPTPTPTPAATPIPTPAPTVQPMKWIFNASTSSPDPAPGKTMQWFANELEKRTNGLIKTQIIWSNGMTQPGEELKSCVQGQAQLVKLVQGFYPTELFLNNFAQSVPFTMTDQLQYAKINNKLYYDERFLDAELEPLGLKFLWSAVNESFTMFSTKPVTKLEDLKGMKIAATPKSYLDWLAAAGAVALPLTTRDRVSGLQTGMIQGSVLPLDLQVGFGEHEVAKYLMSLDFGAMNGEFYCISLKVFNSLPPDIQQTMLKLGKDAGDWYLPVVIDTMAKLRETLKTKGIVMNPSPTFEDKVKWSNMLSEYVNDWVKEGEKMGKPARALMKRYMALVKETGYKFPREWKVE